MFVFSGKSVILFPSPNMQQSNRTNNNRYRIIKKHLLNLEVSPSATGLTYCALSFLVIMQDLEESEEYLRNCSRRIPTLKSFSNSLTKVRQIIHQYWKDVDYYDYVRYQHLKLKEYSLVLFLNIK